MNYLRGTPWVVLWLRAMGCRIGDYVFMGSLQITEFDLVEVGDHAIIGVDAVLQVRGPMLMNNVCRFFSLIWPLPCLCI